MSIKELSKSKKISLKIKHKAAVLGIVYPDTINDMGYVSGIVRRFCKFLSKIELRDCKKNEWRVAEESIFYNKEVLEYAKIVKKSRRKPRHKRSKK